MKTRHRLLDLRVLLMVALVLGAIFVPNAVTSAVTAPNSAANGAVYSAATPDDGTPTVGQQITVTINIDMTEKSPPDDKLGSFTGTLNWNTAVISYTSHSGPLAGFSGLVNNTAAGSGQLTFNGANAAGVTGDIDVLTVTFQVVGPGTSTLNLEYSAMAAASTFADLLPVQVTDGEVVASDGAATPTPTNTTVIPTNTVGPTPTPTNTPVIPTPTNTPVIPTPTRTLTPVPGTCPGAASSAIPSNTAPTVGSQITVRIYMDMTGVAPPNDYLGSFTGTLNWNTAVLQYVSHTAYPGGWTGVFNEANVATGQLAFNAAKPSGDTGAGDAFTITFNVVGPGTSALDLAYSAMAAANTFCDLLPGLTVTDGSVTASGGATPTQTLTPSGPTPTQTLTPVPGACTGAVSSASPDNGTPTVGQQVVVSINIDMSGVAAPNDLLGSFTGSLNWNTAVLAYNTNSGILAGFTGAVNTGNVGSGQIAFNGANASGASGNNVVFRVTFDVVGPGTSALDLAYSAMSSTSPNFCNLLSGLTVNDGSVTASGTVTCYALTRTHTGSGTDPVASPTNSANCPSGQYLSGTTIALTAYPDTGWVVGSWTGTNNDSSTATTNQVTMPASAHTAGVNYVSAAGQFVLTTDVEPNGAGWMTPWEGEHAYDPGELIPVTAYPYAGYRFDHWSGACSGSGSCSVLMDADKSVTAHFVPLTYDLTIAVDPVGGGTTNPVPGVHTYAEGVLVEITATPATGYMFSSWSGACTGSNSCFVRMDADKEVTAHFAQATRNLTVVVSPAGAGTTNPSEGIHTYAHGAVVNVTATPATGYVFSSWSGACTGSGSCSVTMDADKTVTANFAQITHNLTVAVSPAGSGTTNPSVGVHTYAYGTVVTVTAAPAAGYAFSSWSGACSGSGSCVVTMDADKSVTANFTQVAYNLTVAVSPIGAGTTNPAVGVHAYAPGTVVTVTAAPAAGFTFTSWSGACSGSGSCVVTMDADKSVTANFSGVSYNLTVAVSPVGAGTTVPAVGVHAYAAGSVVTVTATPATGYTFSSWSGACSGSGACVVTMDADKSVTANFAQITHNLTVAVSPVGSGTTNPSVGVHVYPYGTVVPVTATPGPGYTFTSWSGACTGTASCTVTMDADKSVTANFALSQFFVHLPWLGKAY